MRPFLLRFGMLSSSFLPLLAGFWIYYLLCIWGRNHVISFKQEFLSQSPALSIWSVLPKAARMSFLVHNSSILSLPKPIQGFYDSWFESVFCLFLHSRLRSVFLGPSSLPCHFCFRIKLYWVSFYSENVPLCLWLLYKCYEVSFPWNGLSSYPNHNHPLSQIKMFLPLSPVFEL